MTYNSLSLVYYHEPINSDYTQKFCDYIYDTAEKFDKFGKTCNCEHDKFVSIEIVVITKEQCDIFNIYTKKYNKLKYDYVKITLKSECPNETNIVYGYNYGLQQCTGQYVIFGMFNPTFDLEHLHNGIEYLNQHNEICAYAHNVKTLDDLMFNVPVSMNLDTSPTIYPMLSGIIFKRSELLSKFNDVYIFLGDLYHDKDPIYNINFTREFIRNCILHNISFEISRSTLCSIKVSKGQIEHVCEKLKNWDKIKSTKIDPDLTIAIVYRNEGNEVLNTVSSINMTTSHLVKILLIDDNSNDGVNYKSIEKIYKNVEFVPSLIQEGVAIKRHKTISEIIKTKYWLLLDGHMRFFDMNWNDMVCKTIQKYPNALLCSNSCIMGKSEYHIKNEHGGKLIQSLVGSAIEFSHEAWKCKWQQTNIPDNAKIIEIPCILGACYFGTVEHYKKNLDGLQILHIYGSDEQYLSARNYFGGFQNLMLRQFYVGHIYRDNAYLQKCYDNIGSIQLANSLLVQYLFGRKPFEELASNTRKRYNSKTYRIIMSEYEQRKTEIERINEAIKSNQKKGFEQYKDFNENYTKHINDFIVEYEMSET